VPTFISVYIMMSSVLTIISLRKIGEKKWAYEKKLTCLV